MSLTFTLLIYGFAAVQILTIIAIDRYGASFALIASAVLALFAACLAAWNGHEDGPKGLTFFCLVVSIGWLVSAVISYRLCLKEEDR